MKNLCRSDRGFTLIELMVVIMIIGLLAAVIVGALNRGRVRAQETKMLQEVAELRKALELYYDKYGYYPQTKSAGSSTSIYHCTSGNPGIDVSGCSAGTSVLQALVTEGFLPSVPRHPNSATSVAATEIYYGAPGWWNTNWGYQIQFQVTKRDDSLGECNGSCPNVYFPGYYSYSVHP